MFSGFAKFMIGTISKTLEIMIIITDEIEDKVINFIRSIRETTKYPIPVEAIPLLAGWGNNYSSRDYRSTDLLSQKPKKQTEFLPIFVTSFLLLISY